MDGSVDNICNATNGKCTCAPGIVGDKCQSKILIFVLNKRENPFSSKRGREINNSKKLYLFKIWRNLIRGLRYYLDTSALDIFGKSVPMRNFKKWY